jgi:hypothetical protein
MTTRDRLMLIGIAALAVLIGAWFTVVAPERERASKVNVEVEAARKQLAGAESQAAGASNARAQYSTAYASLVSLGQAVPASAETPALIYTLDRATHVSNVQFSSITSGAGGAGGSGGSGGSASATPSALSAGFTQQPFTFVFNGSFVELYKLLNRLEGFTVQTPTGSLHVNGRLLTIDAVNLSPSSTGAQSAAKSGKPKSDQLTGTVTATAYVLPAGVSPLGGGTATAPAGNSTPASSAPSKGSSSGATTPAVVKVNP